MASKTLSQLTGGRPFETGDIVYTRNNTLTSGETLLECDAASFNTGTYPDLATLISASRQVQNVEYFRNSDDEMVLFPEYFAVGEGTNGRCVLACTNDWGLGAVDGEQYIWVTPNNTDIGTRGSATKQTDVYIDADAVYPAIMTQTTAGNDLVVEYDTPHDANFFGPSSRTVDITDNHDPRESLHQEVSAKLAVSGNGLIGIACSIYGTTTAALYVGSNATHAFLDTSWTKSSNTLTVGGPGVAERSPHFLNRGAINNTGSDAVFPSSLGVFRTVDTGVNIAGPTLLTNNEPARGLAMDSSDNVYAVSLDGNYIDKSTDTGATWSNVFKITDIPVLLPEGYPRPTMRDIDVDSSDRIYVLADSVPAAGVNTILVLYLSTDAGVTWTHTVQPIVPSPFNVRDIDRYSAADPIKSLPSLPSDNATLSTTDSVGHIPLIVRHMRVKPDGTKMYFSNQNPYFDFHGRNQDGTVQDRPGFPGVSGILYEADITAGSFLPYLPGFRIVSS